MHRHKINHQGFTYLLLLWWVAIGGFMLASLARSWTMSETRVREEEFVFRGEQIRMAIQSYANEHHATAESPYPKSMADLLEDRRGPKLKRHLRILYSDPLTPNGQWVLIQRDGRIIGVHSASEKQPIRTINGVTRYSDWYFEVPYAVAASTASSAVITQPRTLAP